jgi:lipopolysaccharide heptosyltransferase I
MWPRNPTLHDPTVKILIVKTSAIGDVIHTLPALLSLRDHYRDAHIAWLVEEAAADIVVGHPALDRVLVARRKTWLADLRSGRVLLALRELARFIRLVRDTRYDLVIDFQGLFKSALWVFLARGVRKVGFDRGMQRAELSHVPLNERVPPVDMNRHAIERGLLLLQGIGIPAKQIRYELPIFPEHEAEATMLLRTAGIGEQDRVVAVNPMARWPTKLWEPSHVAAVADRLERQGIRVVFTGEAQDRSSIDEICRLMTSESCRLDGRTSLKTLAAIYRRAQVLLTTDSGPMHLGAAVGTSVVALFGPTAPWRTGPYGPQHSVLRTGISCSPCFKKKCLTKEYEERACLKRVGVDEVVQAVLDKLAAWHAAPITPASH